MWENFKSWLDQPFKAEMSAFHWFLFLGLLIALNVAWALILREMRDILEG